MGSSDLYPFNKLATLEHAKAVLSLSLAYAHRYGLSSTPPWCSHNAWSSIHRSLSLTCSFNRLRLQYDANCLSHAPVVGHKQALTLRFA